MKAQPEARQADGEKHLGSGAPPIPRWKRACDLVLTLLSSPLWLPVAALIAIGIKLHSRGPILFKQLRVGYRGTLFTCLKFRSMKVGADQARHKTHLERLIRSGAPLVKLDERGDERVFGFGKLLRATGLDELPQLINVLRGEMSIVGPRPCLPYEYAAYPEWAKKRFEALPGLTGYWQVYGKNRTTFYQMIQMDIWYVEHCSPRLDFLIIARTPVVVARQFIEMLVRRRWRAADTGQTVDSAADAQKPELVKNLVGR
ncbi:MAG: sugar transferase [Verrucomicrobiae bacterium]|nr:sugar transferase [Verrucomicrobiae bacterium]